MIWRVSLVKLHNFFLVQEKKIIQKTAGRSGSGTNAANEK